MAQEVLTEGPAGRVLIIENEVKNINDKIDRLSGDVREIRSEIGDLRRELKQEIQSSKTLSVTLFIAILGLVGSMFIKLFFFM